jgi:hypothetical protein
VEDKAFLGLTMRQLLTAAVCVALAYGAADQVQLPLPARAVLAALVLAGGALLTFWQPAGRPVEVWAFVLLQYATTGRAAVWRPSDQEDAPASEVDPDPVLVRLSAPARAPE